jgi:DNA helicase-2/ATP-dependent DNA helicase PcrA
MSKQRDSVIDRTRRLLYVCCSRSTSALAIVFYSHDVELAVSAMREAGLPGSDQLVVVTDDGSLAQG